MKEITKEVEQSLYVLEEPIDHSYLINNTSLSIGKFCKNNNIWINHFYQVGVWHRKMWKCFKRKIENALNREIEKFKKYIQFIKCE